jgi:hypothetical protein
MDVDRVESIALGKPMKVEEGQWFCELIVHSSNGTVALQLLADDPGRFKVESESVEDLETDSMAAPPAMD